MKEIFKIQLFLFILFLSLGFTLGYAMFTMRLNYAASGVCENHGLSFGKVILESDSIKVFCIDGEEDYDFKATIR